MVSNCNHANKEVILLKKVFFLRTSSIDSVTVDWFLEYRNEKSIIHKNETNADVLTLFSQRTHGLQMPLVWFPQWHFWEKFFPILCNCVLSTIGYGWIHPKTKYRKNILGQLSSLGPFMGPIQMKALDIRVWNMT